MELDRFWMQIEKLSPSFSQASPGQHLNTWKCNGDAYLLMRNLAVLGAEQALWACISIIYFRAVDLEYLLRGNLV
jgi:hypothetical protein